VLAPAGTPRTLIGTLHAATIKVLQMPDVRDTFAKQGLEIVGSTPEHFGEFIKSEITKWGKVVRDSGAKVD
jgi:tripartite-type tricarboxylate transporter receptor subunit TctC